MSGNWEPQLLWGSRDWYSLACKAGFKGQCHTLCPVAVNKHCLVDQIAVQPSGSLANANTVRMAGARRTAVLFLPTRLVCPNSSHENCGLQCTGGFKDTLIKKCFIKKSFKPNLKSKKAVKSKVVPPKRAPKALPTIPLLNTLGTTNKPAVWKQSASLRSGYHRWSMDSWSWVSCIAMKCILCL